ncbi:hypothetical protein CBR_g39331 [Chara braunii]|uniref:Uncharacterized protein n=1 Tax=Chara braunii TaxID=69332 RepID=A0A388K180_CHABU|nr:hypothetical protein CBR_g39331 [Chara braunii]|eukprot:GBG63787.1 hypothetical protein CBR_g39331 [Chara braunii]
MGVRRSGLGTGWDAVGEARQESETSGRGGRNGRSGPGEGRDQGGRAEIGRDRGEKERLPQTRRGQHEDIGIGGWDRDVGMGDAKRGGRSTMSRRDGMGVGRSGWETGWDAVGKARERERGRNGEVGTGRSGLEMRRDEGEVGIGEKELGRYQDRDGMGRSGGGIRMEKGEVVVEVEMGDGNGERKAREVAVRASRGERERSGGELRRRNGMAVARLGSETDRDD